MSSTTRRTLTRRQWAAKLYAQTKRYAAGPIPDRGSRASHEHTLTVDWIERQLGHTGRCDITGIPFDLSFEPNNRKVGKNPFAPSIDRINPDRGYTRDNVQFVVQIYNIATGRYSRAAFEKLVTHYYWRMPVGVGELTY